MTELQWSQLVNSSLAALFCFVPATFFSLMFNHSIFYPGFWSRAFLYLSLSGFCAALLVVVISISGYNNALPMRTIVVDELIVLSPRSQFQYVLRSSDGDLYGLSEHLYLVARGSSVVCALPQFSFSSYLVLTHLVAGPCDV